MELSAKDIINAITAGAKAQVSGSDVVAAQDLTITGRSVTIDPGLEQSQASESHDFKQSGLTVAVSSPVISAVQTAQSMKHAASQSKDARVQALAAATTALAAKNAYDAVAPGAGVASGVTISATYGESKSHSESQSSSTTTTGSLVKAGKRVMMGIHIFP